ncbi:DUF2599 domain-containing protein [Nocardia sp. NEAU-351]|uniref:DUF2599 domain-containing protein n=1 Tax=Nocardia bovistercoris TaxID=2785916 RepID=A0A931IG73_9NOCA|nr:DUF2599 domain-containing protein [Nocardia bovistercoris]MBH0779185.1 DUF2599 domain-containing protein [Nocardia bovistercoris]
MLPLIACADTGDTDPVSIGTLAASTAVPTATVARSASALTTPAGLPTVDPYAGLPLIERVEWTSNVDGPRLLVFPTTAGRRTTTQGSDERAWQEVLALSADAESPGMRDQFVCHWEWARLVQPNKPSWNLEPWRPDVGYQAVVAASCNPGGPER